MELQKSKIDTAALRKRSIMSFVLLFIFAAAYFIAAIINTAEFKHVAGTQILGLPLAFHLGVLVFIVGLVVTHVHLAQSDKKSGGK